MVNGCLHLSVNMKRCGGRRKPDGEVSRWLLQMRRESADEAPLVVPKVIRQYTRKKKSPAEPENKLVSPDVAAACSEQSTSKVEADNYNHVKIKEEYITDIKFVSVDIENHVKIKEPDGSEIKNNYETLDRNCLYRKQENQIKKENLTEIKINGNNAQETCLSAVKDTIRTKRENVSKINPSNVIEREQQQPRRDITIKIEPADDSENTHLDQNIDECHFEKGKAVGIQLKTDNIEEGKNVVLEIMNVPNTMGQRFQENLLKDKTLVTEEIIIKEEIESDDSEIAVITNIKEDPVCDGVTPAEQVKTGITSGCQSLVAQGRESVNYRTPDVTALKKCYLVAVDVAPSTSGVPRQVAHGRHVALLAANSQQVVDPVNLAGFKVVAKSQIFTCDMCGEHFLSRAGVRQHVRGAHSVATNFPCHCGARFAHNFLLLAHKRAHSGSLACDLCPKRFVSTYKYAYHLNTHLRERLFSCPVCVRRYPVFANLRRHAARHKATDVFQCTSCSASYRCITDLRRHSERDHGERANYPCYVCTQTLPSNAEFIAHVKSHDNALHQCAFCAKRFTDAQKWEEHSAAHIARLEAVAPIRLPYICNVCRMRFEYRSVLKTHMSCHTGERPYKCKACSKTFKTSSAVAEHEKGHEKPYGCAECGARFAKRGSLARHALVHSGERPHACPSCARAFAQRSSMRQHVRRFHTPGLKRAKKAAKKRKLKA